MKRILLLAALNVAIVFNANAYDFSAVASSGQTLYYNISGTNVTLTYPGSYGYPYPSGGPTGSLIIPSSVTYSGVTYTVNTVGYMAFYGCNGLTSVTFPNSITTISEGAFQYCGLTSITCQRQTPPTLANDYVFDGVGSSIPINIPCGASTAYQNAWSYFSNFLEPEVPTITVNTADNTMGTTAITTINTCSNPNAVIEAYANEGYHFSHWNDNNTSNPRSVNVIDDVTYTAYFEANPVIPIYYTIVVESNDYNMGYGWIDGAANAGAFLEGTSITIEGIAYNELYQFVRWQDGNTDNPRTITVTEDATYTAYFEEVGDPNPPAPPTSYLIIVESNNPSMGSVEGGGYFEEGSTATIQANPYNGYRFVRWQDNNTQNPRTITVTGDATYTAYFMATQGIGEVISDAVSLCIIDGNIVVETELNDEISIYDIVGRKVDGGHKTCFNVPVPGVYLVKIGALFTQKVVVIR